MNSTFFDNLFLIFKLCLKSLAFAGFSPAISAFFLPVPSPPPYPCLFLSPYPSLFPLSLPFLFPFFFPSPSFLLKLALSPIAFALPLWLASVGLYLVRRIRFLSPSVSPSGLIQLSPPSHSLNSSYSSFPLNSSLKLNVFARLLVHLYPSYLSVHKNSRSEKMPGKNREKMPRFKK